MILKMKSIFTAVLLILLVNNCHSKAANLVLVENAVMKGAVCLDGSPPGYYIRKGSGDGVSKWILHLEGGGWCGDEANCLARSKGYLGTSTLWPQTQEFHGFLSDNATVNPDFYNWNVAFLMYCDGASFIGDRVNPVNVLDSEIFMRGGPILDVLLDNLNTKGLAQSTEVILTGCSAGGLATYLNADYVGTRLPWGIKYRAFSDAGYFLDTPDVYGNLIFRKNVTYGIYMQNVTVRLDQECLKSYDCADAWRCFFAPYLFSYIKTPTFVANSMYDTAQLLGMLGLGCLPPNCSAEQMEFFNNFKIQFFRQLRTVIDSSTAGLFADSCLVHCQTLTDDTWSEVLVTGQSMRETFAIWYFGRSGSSKVIDCPYPCNPTCPEPRAAVDFY